MLTRSSIEEKNYHLLGRILSIKAWSKISPKYVNSDTYICDLYGLVDVSYSDTEVTLKTTYAFWTYNLVFQSFSIEKVNYARHPYETSGFSDLKELNHVLFNMTRSLDWLIKNKLNHKKYSQS